jgi:hypothetical protein
MPEILSGIIIPAWDPLQGPDVWAHSPERGVMNPKEAGHHVILVPGELREIRHTPDGILETIQGRSV